MIDQIDLELKIDRQFHEEKIRLLDFSGAKNFRDLGGYRTVNGRTVRWRTLYRSDQLKKLTDADLSRLTTLGLNRIVDFRAKHEKEEAPDRLPSNTDIHTVEIPILDSSTEIWRDSRNQFITEKLKNIDPNKFMIETNIELATRFTPQMGQFINELVSAQGRPVLFHCAAGKDRTGFAAAIILRILGGAIGSRVGGLPPFKSILFIRAFMEFIHTSSDEREKILQCSKRVLGSTACLSLFSV